MPKAHLEMIDKPKREKRLFPMIIIGVLASSLVALVFTVFNFPVSDALNFVLFKDQNPISEQVTEGEVPEVFVQTIPGGTGNECAVSFEITSQVACEELTNNPDPNRGAEVTWSCVATQDSDDANFAQFRMWRDEIEIDSASSSVINRVGSWTTTTPSEDGSYLVECRLCVDEQSTNCTQWGESN
jgi:hypothetical protein